MYVWYSGIIKYLIMFEAHHNHRIHEVDGNCGATQPAAAAGATNLLTSYDIRGYKR